VGGHPVFLLAETPSQACLKALTRWQGHGVGSPNISGWDLSIQVTHSNGARVLHLSGELDLANIHQLLEAVTTGDGPLIIDTTGLDFIGSSGVGALVGICQRVGPSHFKLIPGERTLRVLQLSGLATHFLPTVTQSDGQKP
jgi:anti-sigma B factor antagonist